MRIGGDCYAEKTFSIINGIVFAVVFLHNINKMFFVKNNFGKQGEVPAKRMCSDIGRNIILKDKGKNMDIENGV